jgi:hypothetical protein
MASQRRRTLSDRPCDHVLKPDVDADAASASRRAPAIGIQESVVVSRVRSFIFFAF